MINDNSILARWSFLLLSVLVAASVSARRPSLRATPDDAPSQVLIESADKTTEPETTPADSKPTQADVFAVKSFSPRGLAETASVIYATFTRDVITTQQLDQGKAPKSVFSFEPSIEGAVQWESLRQVRFVPTRKLRQATEYVAHINPLLRSADGDKLSDAEEYRFHTPALTLVTAQQARFTDDRRVGIMLKFSDKIKPQDLRKHVTLQSGSDEVGWKLESEVASSTPMIITDPMSTDVLRVVVEPGLRGTDGPLGIRNRIEKSVELNFRLTPVSLTGAWESGSPRFNIRFSDYVGGANADKYVVVNPPVKNVSFSGGGENLIVRGDFEAEKRYSITVKDGFKNYQNKVVLKPVTMSAWMPPMAPFLELPDSSGYLGTNSRMRLQVRSGLINQITVTARRVFDNNLPYYSMFRSNSSGVEALGRKVAEKTYDIAIVPNKVQNSEVDLRDLLGPDATGVYSLQVVGNTPQEDLLPDNGNYWARRNARNALRGTAMINLSNLGIVSKMGVGEVQVFIAALDTATPLPGIHVQVFSGKNQLLGDGMTDEIGLVTIGEIAMGDPDVEPAVVVAQTPDKKQVAVLNMRDSLSGLEQFNSSGRDFVRTGYEVFLTPERGTYRPGETAHLSGFVRARDSAIPSGAFPLQILLQRPDGKEMTPIVETPTDTGLLTFDMAIPQYAPTGRYNVEIRMPGASENDDDYDESGQNRVLGRSSFLVEEFVPNRVKIEAQAEDRRYGVNDPIKITVSAEEMFGQPIANRPVSGSVTWATQPFQPEKWEGFTFGDNERKFTERELALGQQILGADGETTISLAPPGGNPPAALRASVQVTVTDGGRGVTRSIARTVDPVPYYIGIHRKGDTYARPGAPAEFEIAAVKPGGETAAVDAVLTGTISRIKWNSSLVRSGESYSFRTRRELVHMGDTSATLTAGLGSISWTPKSAGNYLVRLASGDVSVSDDFYVSDSQWGHQPWSLEKPETAELILDKEHYSAGETARLLIKAPFPGTVLLTLEQDRVVSSTILKMTENTVEVPIKLTEEMLPNVYAVASVIRPVVSAKQWLPHRAVGMVNLPVTTGSRVLDIALSVPEEVRPNSDMAVTAEVRDRMTSAPVAGDIIVWAVDEGVLTLTDFETPSPGNYFSAARRLMVQTADFFSSLMPDLITGARALSATGGGDMDAGPRFSPVGSERIKPVILWQGPARTGADGRVQIEWEVPQFMGRLRVMAMAADGKRFGSDDAVTFVRNPVMVKEYLPRFAAPGDQFKAGFTVYNNTDAPMQPTLAVSAGDLVTVDPSTSETLASIPARSQATVYRDIAAASEQVGQAVISFSAMAGNENFGSSVSLPIRPASPRIRESGSLVVKAGQTVPVEIQGSDFLPDTTTVTLVAGAMPGLELADALVYNIGYPYGCSEQVISSLFPLLYLGDLARITDPGRFSEEGLRAIVQQGIDRVLMTQTASGGLAMWIGHREPWPWASTYGAHFLVEAKKAGYQVNPDYMDALLDYLSDDVAVSVKGQPQDELTRHAYSCYVLVRSGRKVHQRLAALQGVEALMSQEGRALLAAAYLEVGMSPEARNLLKAIPVSADEQTTGVRRTGGILSSPARETAILLMAWLEADPDSAQVGDLVLRLLNMRKDGKWGTTQENTFAMMALGRYAQAMASTEPVSGTVRFAGETRSFSTSEPLTLARADLAGATVTIHCSSGTAYAWYSAEGVPSSPPNEPVSRGLSLTRKYLDRAGNVLDPTRIQQGQLVIVELAVSGRRSLENVVLQDLLPAGLEVENPRLTSTESVEEAEKMTGVIVNRVDMRDDRILVFANLSRTEKDLQTYRYTARAVSPGEFILPPAMLEVMYDPSITARTAPGHMHISARN